MEQIVWATGAQYLRYRIPGVIVTQKGTILLYCEARKSPDDWAEMDILLRRSEDGGKTFSEEQKIACGTKERPTVNNPVLMQDGRGRIHFLYCETYAIGGGRVLQRYSDDDGVTWSAPKDISYATFPEKRNVFALGPGHGICTREGRLLVPFWTVLKESGAAETAHAPSRVGTLYSDDGGGHWHAGGLVPSRVQSANESAVCQLQDGRLYLNIRCEEPHRAFSLSKSGIGGWSAAEADGRLPDPRCFGSVCAVEDGAHPYTVLFVNCESETERKNIVLKGSCDGLKSWSLRKVIDAARGGYADLAADTGRGCVYVLYEEAWGMYERFATVPFAELYPENKS